MSEQRRERDRGKKVFFAAIRHADKYAIKLDLNDTETRETHLFELEAEVALKMFKQWPLILKMLNETE